MKATWLQKKIIHQFFGTERGDNIIAFLESEAVSAAFDLLKATLLPAIIALLKKDWSGFYASLPSDWQPEIKAIQFIAAPAGSRAVGMVNRLDGKGWVTAQSPDERVAVSAALAEHSAKLISNNV